jgi:hypothetical protein
MDLQKEVLVDTSGRNSIPNVYYIHDFAIDSAGSLFILANDFVLKCSRNGELLKSARQVFGQGPGEFNQIVNHIYVDRTDKVLIEDGNKLVVFSNDLRYETNILLNPCYNPVCFGLEHHLYATTDKYGPKKIEKVLSEYDQNGNTLCSIASYDAGGYQRQGGVTVRSDHPYRPKAYYCTYDRYLYYSNNLEYVIYKYDSNCRLVKKIVVDEKGEKLSSQEREATIQKTKRYIKANFPLDIPMDFPVYRPYLEGLLCDENGRLYAIRFKSILDESEVRAVDIFDKEGHFLYATTIPSLPKIIANGFIYALESYQPDKNSDKNYRIVRFTIKNYDSLRSTRPS